MAIQFFCSACGQPIEVDDNMANLTVTCPYCHKVVVTPPQSNLAARPDLPTPVAGVMPGVLPTTLTLPPPRSILGWLALGCMAVSTISIIYCLVSLVSLGTGLDPKQPQEYQKVIAERAEALPVSQKMGLAGSCVCSIILPLVGVVLAIIALVRRSQPRWPAITALCLFGAVIVLLCAGSLMNAGTRPPGS